MEELNGGELVERARSIAVAAHAGQLDKAGADYIGHPARVAARLDDAEGQAAAWLHDVIEDTRDLEPPRGVTADDLLAQGIPGRVVDAVKALSHTDGEPRARYYERVKAAGDLAVRVKLADIGDNTDPERLAQLDAATRERLVRKYAAARVALGAPGV